MMETIERIGVCEHKQHKQRTLFHRVKVKLSRKFRVWPVPGDDRSLLMDPTEFVERFRVVQEFKN